MNTLVVYFSKFGNTQMLAETIGDALSSAGNLRVISSEQLEVADFHGVDLVIMGSPTHKMNSCPRRSSRASFLPPLTPLTRCRGG
jgi:flavodoxin